MTHAEHTKLRHQQLLGFNDDATGEEGQHSSPPRRPPRDDFEVVPGWLHTYRMKRDLRVIYIDGEAAAKSQKGTLDTQDYILAPVSDHNGEREPGHSPGGEYRRARDMCNMAEHAWLGRIDGFIRMEHGFELILCDFEESSDLVQMSRVNDWRGVSNDDVGVFLFTFLRAIVARYHRIGGERVRIDYDNFVTAFASDLDLFRSSSSDLPRLDSITNEQRAKLIADLTEVVMNYDSELTPENWQSIADLIVARYSDALHSFAFDTFSSKSVLDFSLTLLLRPFIDYDARNRSLELSRCATSLCTSIPTKLNSRHGHPRRLNTYLRSAFLHLQRHGRRYLPIQVQRPGRLAKVDNLERLPSRLQVRRVLFHGNLAHGRYREPRKAILCQFYELAEVFRTAWQW